MQKISFIYFDVGGVVIHDFSGTNNWDELKKELRVKESQWDEFDKFWNDIEPDLCRGKELSTLITVLNEKFSLNLPTDFSLLQPFFSRFTKNTSIWPIVQKVMGNHRVGLLTNMYPGLFEKIQERQLIPNLSWEQIIDSSVVGFQKPERQIYEIAKEKANAEHSEIFFIDNTQVNLVAAKDIGWNTFLYDPKDTTKSNQNLLQALEEYKIIT